LALRVQKQLENSHVLDQYKNPSNPLAHYENTAEEIIEQCQGKIDHIVMTAGTGGTLTGIARKIKEKLPNCKIVGVDPKGSILAQPEELNEEGLGVPYHVEGIGYDFLPNVLDRQVCDKWYKSADQESFEASREVIRTEGILCGGSSGSAMAACLKYIKDNNIGADERVVVLFPDSIRNYMSKFLDDGWMEQEGFMVGVVEEDPMCFFTFTLTRFGLPAGADCVWLDVDTDDAVRSQDPDEAVQRVFALVWNHFVRQGVEVVARRDE